MEGLAIVAIIAVMLVVCAVGIPVMMVIVVIHIALYSPQPGLDFLAMAGFFGVPITFTALCFYFHNYDFKAGK